MNYQKKENHKLLPGTTDTTGKLRELEESKKKIALFARTLDLMILLNEEDRFLAVVLTLCNELAARLQCSRVSLGWLEGRYIQVQGLSHIENFEPKMESVKELETAMEESLDQNEEIIWPDQVKCMAAARSHESYCRKFGSEYMVSLPLRIADEPVAVLSCERSIKHFTRDDVRGIRLICDQAVRRLFDLKQRDRWFGARLAGWSREKMRGLLGVEHTFVKIAGIICSLVLAFILFGQWEYRVEAPCTIKTDTLVYLTAPYNGYVRDVMVTTGDVVKKNDFLLNLDTREFLLQEAEALANVSRFRRLAEKARADNALADMRIAQAQMDQASAQLDRVRYHLKNAQMTAPFSGIVVDGDKRKLLGVPVRKGDTLLKLARLEKYFILLDISEEDIHEIEVNDTGQVSFLSRPEAVFSIRITRIAPTALIKEKNNVFEIRAVFEGDSVPWWRPGMSGIGKISIEKRPVYWILTHRTLDFLYLHRWW